MTIMITFGSDLMPAQKAELPEVIVTLIFFILARLLAIAANIHYFICSEEHGSFRLRISIPNFIRLK